MFKVGIIGAGTLGKTHIENWKFIEEADIIGFYDPDDDTAINVSEKYQLPRFLDTDLLLDACDAVDITLPVIAHFECCEKAVRKGKHIFITAPMTQTLHEAGQLVKLIKESGIKFHVACSGRFNTGLLAIKDILLNPSLIELYHHIEFNDESAEKNMIPDVMIHDIGLILSIVKSDVKNISATSTAVVTDDPDIVSVRLEFHNGCVVNLTCSRVSMKNKKKLHLFQKDICMDIDLLNKKTEIIKLKESKDSNVFAFDIETTTGKKTFITDHLFTPETNEIISELEEFKNAIINNTKPVISEIEGLVAMDVVHQVLHKTGRVLVK